MGNVKDALTRKIGPLPAWTWFIFFGVGVWYYRRKLGGSTATVSGTGTGSVAPASGPPQSPVTLAPGESVYDPNTGALTSAPGGGSSDYGQGVTDLADAILQGLTENQAGSKTSPTHNGTGGKPGKNDGKRAPKLRGKGAIPAPSGAKKPTSPKGYTSVGLGRGFWEFLPKARRGGTTTKQQGRKRAKVKAPPKPARHQGPVTRATGEVSPAPVRSRTNTHTPKPTTRNRPKTPVVSTVTNQRPTASHSRPTGGVSASPPRPSAPPPRKATRTVSRPTTKANIAKPRGRK